MMRYNFTFICRDSKADRNGKAPIEMTIGIGGKRANLTLPMRLKPEQLRKYNILLPNDQNKKGYSHEPPFSLSNKVFIK